MNPNYYKAMGLKGGTSAFQTIILIILSIAIGYMITWKWVELPVINNFNVTELEFVRVGDIQDWMDLIVEFICNPAFVAMLLALLGTLHGLVTFIDYRVSMMMKKGKHKAMELKEKIF
jgi:uncharacterized membrane protein